MKTSRLHFFISVFQIVRIAKCLPQVQNEIPDEIIYPRLYNFPRSKRDVEDNKENEKLAIIKTENTTFYVELIPNNELLSKEFDSEGLNYANHSAEPCLFQGRILSNQGGMAAISTCDGNGIIHGMLLTPEGKYTIQPLSFLKPHLDFPPIERDAVPHVISRSYENVEEFCGTDHFAPKGAEVDNEIADNRKRKKRSSSPQIIIEIAVFADNNLTAHCKAKKINCKNFILSILNQVQLIYKYKSLKTRINIVVVMLKSTSDKNSPEKAGGDIDKYLDNFCIWQVEEKRKSNISWDLAILLTSIDLYKSLRNSVNKKVLGLAWVNGMCRNRYSCTLCEATSFEAAFVIAHEMGHSLSMLHDGSNNSCDPEKYIMSPKTGAGKTNWSRCSNTYLEEFLKTLFASCLFNYAENSQDLTKSSDTLLPGEKFPPKFQCKLILGEGYEVYNNSKHPYNNICSELWCVQGYWATPAHPALEGSSCANGKICLEGNCVTDRRSKPARQKPETTRNTRTKPTQRGFQKSPSSTSKPPAIIDRIRQFWNNVASFWNRYVTGKR